MSSCDTQKSPSFIKALTHLFKEPLYALNDIQNTRVPWILMIIVTFGLTCVAHFFFQEYLYMEACEQCVYIRFAMIVMTIGGLIAAFRPQCNVAKFIGYTLGFYGIVIGVEFCLTLNHIHEVVHSANPFGGVDGCREIPIFPFNLPLYEWSPGWFLPTGECGLDNPIVPEEAYKSLSPIQQFFVGTEKGDFMDGFYSDGWYLIPAWKFMNMAIACLLAFVCCFICLGAMFIGYVAKGGAKAKLVAIATIVITAVLVIAGG